VRIENSFEVPRGPEEVWALLLDVPRMAPCMPGAELLEVVDDRSWRGKVTVRMGPVSLSYAGTVVMEERDDVGRRAVISATGTETRGKGTAQARVTSHLEPSEHGGTRVAIEADLTLSGAVAQFGRGMIADVSRRLTDEFARCVGTRFGAASEEPSKASPPVAGLRLGLWAFLRAWGRVFSRVWRSIIRPVR
jgi:carbon monoxide dehydrogenase subunit G